MNLEHVCQNTKYKSQTQNTQMTTVNKSWVSRLSIEGVRVWGQENRLYLS